MTGREAQGDHKTGGDKLYSHGQKGSGPGEGEDIRWKGGRGRVIVESKVMAHVWVCGGNESCPL